MAGHRSRATGRYQDGKESNLRKDLESGRPAKDRKYRFRDNGHLEPDDQRRVEFKKKLLDSVEQSDLESFRRSDEEVRQSDLHGCHSILVIFVAFH
jgi:nucleosome binding factor SPN SPT16 subunit